MTQRQKLVSRETRLLLITLFVSLAALWVLARIRFPERQAAPNPVGPVLAQLAQPSAFDDLPTQVFQLESRLAASLVALEMRRPEGTDDRANTVSGMRIDVDTAVTLLEQRELEAAGLSVIARDPGSGLTVVRVSNEPVTAIATWSLARPQFPRYFVVSDASPAGTTLRPVFVGALYPIQSAVWATSIWGVPPSTDLAPGAFVFTTEGALAGLAVRTDRRVAIVPSEVVLNLARQLLRNGSPRRSHLGVDVEPLTTELAPATGANAGVVVTWVDPRGPAAGLLAVTDVIEGAGADASLTYDTWRAQEARLSPGESIQLRVRHRSEIRSVTVTAGPAPASRDARPLGLMLRALRRVGVEVIRVDPGSAAAQAKIEPRDVITLIGDRAAPSPLDVRRAFDAAAQDDSILVAITRGERHLVVVLRQR